VPAYADGGPGGLGRRLWAVRRAGCKDDTIHAWEGANIYILLGFYAYFPLLVFLVQLQGGNEVIGRPFMARRLPFIARQMTSAVASTPDRLVRLMQRAWPPTLVLMALFWGAFMALPGPGISGVPLSAERGLGFMMGWRELG